MNCDDCGGVMQAQTTIRVVKGFVSHKRLQLQGFHCWSCRRSVSSPTSTPMSEIVPPRPPLRRPPVFAPIASRFA
jgi:hypothetical protein